MRDEIFEKYPVPKAYMKLALPVVFSMVVSLVYNNMVDTYFIAGTGNTDLVAGVVFMGVVLISTCTFQSAGRAVGAFLLSVSRQF